MYAVTQFPATIFTLQSKSEAPCLRCDYQYFSYSIYNMQYLIISYNHFYLFHFLYIQTVCTGQFFLLSSLLCYLIVNYHITILHAFQFSAYSSKCNFMLTLILYCICHIILCCQLIFDFGLLGPTWSVGPICVWLHWSRRRRSRI